MTHAQLKNMVRLLYGADPNLALVAADLGYVSKSAFWRIFRAQRPVPADMKQRMASLIEAKIRKAESARRYLEEIDPG